MQYEANKSFRYNVLKEYYFRLPVQYAMFNYLKNREFAMLVKSGIYKSVRHIRATNVQGLQFWFKNMNAFYKGYNLYYSMAEFDHVPDRSGNRTARLIGYARRLQNQPGVLTAPLGERLLSWAEQKLQETRQPQSRESTGPKATQPTRKRKS